MGYAQRIVASVADLKKANLATLQPIKISLLRRKFDSLLDEMESETILDQHQREALAKARGAVAFHQLQWGTCRMLKSPDEYRRAAAKLEPVIADLVEALRVSDACELVNRT